MLFSRHYVIIIRFKMYKSTAAAVVAMLSTSGVLAQQSMMSPFLDVAYENLKSTSCFTCTAAINALDDIMMTETV